MPTVKRRTLWVTDEDWAVMRGMAEEQGMNVSQLMRHRFILGELDEMPVPYSSPVDRLLGPAPDRFGAPRPAPKPGKR